MTTHHIPAAAQVLYERGWFSAFRRVHGSDAPFSEFYTVVGDLLSRGQDAERFDDYVAALGDYHRSHGRNHNLLTLGRIARADLAVAA